MDADIGANIAGSPTFERFRSERNGSFVGTSARDGILRHYAFTQVGELPLILDIATAVDDIEADWGSKAAAIGAIVVTLCCLTMALAIFLVRELRRRSEMEREVRRANDELSRLSLTDALTGLPNRRRFDEALDQACREARRRGGPLSLVMIDADHFKRFNDLYGHQVGDAVLQSLARSLASATQRPGDVVCRLGGEEFAILMPDTDEAGASRIAGRVHAVVADLEVVRAGIAGGMVTVSVGQFTWERDAVDPTPEDLYRLVDEAVYAAKAPRAGTGRAARTSPGVRTRPGGPRCAWSRIDVDDGPSANEAATGATRLGLGARTCHGPGMSETERPKRSADPTSRAPVPVRWDVRRMRARTPPIRQSAGNGSKATMALRPAMAPTCHWTTADRRPRRRFKRIDLAMAFCRRI